MNANAYVTEDVIGEEQLAQIAQRISDCSKLLAQGPKKRMLDRDDGSKVERSAIKFHIVLAVREKMRVEGKPPPAKMDIVRAVQGPLGMNFSATCAYIYERLSSDQIAALELAERPLSGEQQIQILKQLRQEMRDNKLPAPTQLDLAKAAAPRLGRKAASIRSLITKLSPEMKKELAFASEPRVFLSELDPGSLHQAFTGAIALLMFRRIPVTSGNLRTLLGVTKKVVDEYLRQHPELKSQVTSGAATIANVQLSSKKQAAGNTMPSRPMIRLDVVYYDETAGRNVSGAVTPSEYADLWKKGRLGFQRSGRPKPERLPSLEEALSLAR